MWWGMCTVKNNVHVGLPDTLIDVMRCAASFHGAITENDEN
jgi:hypothetical protein